MFLVIGSSGGRRENQLSAIVWFVSLTANFDDLISERVWGYLTVGFDFQTPKTKNEMVTKQDLN